MEFKGQDTTYQLTQDKPMYPIDARKCQSVEELGLLFNVLGIAVTEEFAEQNGITHLMIK
jgi:hypothetical protein